MTLWQREMKIHHNLFSQGKGLSYSKDPNSDVDLITRKSDNIAVREENPSPGVSST